MIAVSLKDGEELVDLFLRKEADVNAKSAFLPLLKAAYAIILTKRRLQRPDCTPLHSLKEQPRYSSPPP